MCKGLIGKKLGMTALFTPEGGYIPVTVLQIGPCTVTQVKSRATDGYDALQIGFETKSDKKTTKPLKGHFGKSGSQPFAHLREVAVDDPSAYEAGQQLNADIFQVGERVDVVAFSKGRGYSGVIKRHGFSGGRDTHGSKSHRVPGSIGCSAWPAKVIKGKKLPGRYGVERKTVRNLQIVDIRPDQHLIMVKGAVPGAKTGLVQVHKRKFAQQNNDKR